MKHQSLREEVARIARAMSVSSFVTGTSGNVSARTPEGDVLITPGGLDYTLLKPEDMVLIDVEGRVLKGSLEPSSETPMHTGIYRSRPEVGGIVHTHARYSTVLACLGWEIPPVHYMLATLSDKGWVPLAPYASYGTEELARHVSEALGDSHLRVPATEPRHHRQKRNRKQSVLQNRDPGRDGRDLLPGQTGGGANTSHP